MWVGAPARDMLGGGKSFAAEANLKGLMAGGFLPTQLSTARTTNPLVRGGTQALSTENIIALTSSTIPHLTSQVDC